MCFLLIQFGHSALRGNDLTNTGQGTGEQIEFDIHLVAQGVDGPAQGLFGFAEPEFLVPLGDKKQRTIQHNDDQTQCSDQEPWVYGAQFYSFLFCFGQKQILTRGSENIYTLSLNKMAYPV
jgi:hypothetical protein